MEFERQYDDCGGKRGAPPGKEECLIWSAGWSAGWARGVLMLMKERGMLLRGEQGGKEEC